MEFLTIAGTAYKTLEFTRLPDETGGKRQRTLWGQRRGGVRWRARQWQGTIICQTSGEADALTSLADDVTPYLCAGDGMPTGGITCHVERGTTAFVRDRSSFYNTVSVTLREVQP